MKRLLAISIAAFSAALFLPTPADAGGRGSRSYGGHHGYSHYRAPCYTPPPCYAPPPCYTPRYYCAPRPRYSVGFYYSGYSAGWAGSYGRYAPRYRYDGCR